MREKRGLNYGDYAYIEYFPRGMFLMEPPQNLARHYQIFQVWIRPVEPPTAKFALRLALFELDKLAKNGMTQEAFERTRDFLSKFVNVLTKSKRAELGYAIDSNFYALNPYNEYLKAQLAKLTLDGCQSRHQAEHPHRPPDHRRGHEERRGAEGPTCERRRLTHDVQLPQAGGDHGGGQAGGTLAPKAHAERYSSTPCYSNLPIVLCLPVRMLH